MENYIKQTDMEQLSLYQRELWINPRLRYIFFELTDKCNLNCRHCGSKCSGRNNTFLPERVIEKTLQSISKECNPREVMVCLTGGEPLLHPRLPYIIRMAKLMGFSVGMTSNGTLITEEMARILAAAGLDTISISIDGLRDTHNNFRMSNECFDKAIGAINNLISAGLEPEIMTVVHNKNINELDALYELVLEQKVYAWRLVNVDPIGRAKLNSEMLLDQDQLRKLFNFIKKKRFDNNNHVLINYGCSHFLSLAYENELRDYYFQCGAGTMVASITSEGNICACLDIERRSDLVQGNIYKEDFMDVWKNRFKPFRIDRTEKSKLCSNCKNRNICLGDSAHTWDFDKNEPIYCVSKMMEEIK